MNANVHRRTTICYLAAVLVLGGASAAGWEVNLLLQLGGAVLAGWSLSLRPVRIGWTAAAIGIAAAVQFVPLPPACWAGLPGREGVAHGFALIGSGLPWLTVSLAPWHSLASLAWWIPALALFLAARVHGFDIARPASRTIVAVAAISMVPGLAQYCRGLGYFYAITNYGKAPGFFANSNHQSLFLLIALICCATAACRDRLTLESLRAHPARIAQVLLIPLFVIGIAINGSLAILTLIVPAAGALYLALRKDGSRGWITGTVVAGTLAAALCAVALMALDVFPNDLFGHAAVPGIGRRAFWTTTLRMIGDFAPLGSGLGTFAQIYHWYEDPATVGTIYVNHAHDDLLELIAEIGVFGLVAVTTFLAWFLASAWRLWRHPEQDVWPRVATIVIAAALLHSLVDYPLRTAALSGVVAIACAIVAAAGNRRRAVDPAGGP